MNLRLLSIALVLLFFASVANASDFCKTDERPLHFSVRHIEGKGVGYSHGYTTIEGFLSSDPFHEKWIPFVDLRSHLLNNGKFAANTGIGMRYLDWKNHRIWGVNTFYDYRRTSHRSYSQCGLGLESLGKILDFRLNGYLPVGGKKSRYFNVGFDHFSDHFMILSRKREFAMKGADAEVGAHVKLGQSLKSLYFAMGPYYLTGGKTAWGGKVRSAVDFCGYFKLEASVSYDNVFKWIGQGQLSFMLPIGAKKKGKTDGKGNAPVFCETYRRVDRNEIIPVDHKHDESPAINPSTGLPWFFVFVDNQSSSQGTFESPYPTLLEAETHSKPGDIIYVFEGGASYPLTATFQMQNNQHLWGSGVSQNLLTTWGSIGVPALTQGYPLIMLTSEAFDIITLANGCEVSGMHLVYDASNTSHRAIFGSNIADALIQKNHIDYLGDLANGGVALLDSPGQLDILNNRLTVGGSIKSGGKGIITEFNTITTNSTFNINQNSVIVGGSIDNGSYGIGTFIASAAGYNNSANFHVGQNGLIVNGSITNGSVGIATRSGAANDNSSIFKIEQNNLIIGGSIDGGSYGLHVGSAATNNDSSRFNINRNSLIMNGSITNGSSAILVGSAAVNGNFSLSIIDHNILMIPGVAADGIGLRAIGVGTSGLIFLNVTDNVFYPYPIRIEPGVSSRIIQYGNYPTPTGL